jgi:signal transduction histidine kinase
MGDLVDITARRRAERDRRELLSRLVQAQEEERARIAEDIHDDSLQKMTAVSLRLHALRRQAEGSDLGQGFRQLESTVSVAIEHMRRLMFDLRPPVLDREGLVAALRAILVEISEDGEFEFELSDGLREEPSAETRTVLYRVLREAFINVAKHAAARSVSVALEAFEDGIRAVVHDDGHGFTVEEALQLRPGHLGLAAMRERVELAGGKWDLESSTEGGTTLVIWVPNRV